LLGGAKLSGKLERLQRQLDQIEAEPTDEDIWHSVELARHPDRPYTLDYVQRLLEPTGSSFATATAAAPTTARMVAGSAAFEGRTVVLVGMQKGPADIQERSKRQFGMPYPEGYRKAMRGDGARRSPRLSSVISLVDTPGAYPGVRRRAARPGGNNRGVGRR